jgi:hypothetical protein
MRQNFKRLLVGLALTLAYRLITHRLPAHRPRGGAEPSTPPLEGFRRSPQQPRLGPTEAWTEQRMRQARPMPMPMPE